jgi:hypothetical protein
MCSWYGLSHKRVLEVDVFCVTVTVGSSIHNMFRLLSYDGQFSRDITVCKKCRVKTFHRNYFFMFYKFCKHLYEINVQTTRSTQNYLKIWLYSPCQNAMLIPKTTWQPEEQCSLSNTFNNCRYKLKYNWTLSKNLRVFSLHIFCEMQCSDKYLILWYFCN